jgi:hypothetical protein
MTNFHPTTAYVAFLLRRFLSRGDRELFVRILQEAQDFVAHDVQLDFDFVIDVLEDPDQEPSRAFKATLALARTQAARTLVN